MANVETIRDEYTFLVQAGATNTSSMSGDSDYKSITILSRDLGARWLTTRSEGHSNGFTVGQKDCLRSKWIPGQLSDFVVSGTGRECSALWRSPARRPAPLPPVYLYLLRIESSTPLDLNHACIHRSTVQPRSAGRDGALQTPERLFPMRNGRLPMV